MHRITHVHVWSTLLWKDKYIFFIKIKEYFLFLSRNGDGFAG